ncbi:hypothetical protein NADFUDRAFT_52218 [Nadsonia fulvescens var. elongata DSM 6958]|uniref:Uncharacterized protein n=1 Tax=Nadsonia fulvescens var. elongata DSM 6958 TaxID=857566 RepID=A0A1E3PH96_9ASCO|nr:hypothetical protein NADFUDRAFT_52218 [Nadsonia fulvescens var. elongata DSM 6958]
MSEQGTSLSAFYGILMFIVIVIAVVFLMPVLSGIGNYRAKSQSLNQKDRGKYSDKGASANDDRGVTSSLQSSYNPYGEGSTYGSYNSSEQEHSDIDSIMESANKGSGLRRLRKKISSAALLASNAQVPITFSSNDISNAKHRLKPQRSKVDIEEDFDIDEFIRQEEFNDKIEEENERRDDERASRQRRGLVNELA